MFLHCVLFSSVGVIPVSQVAPADIFGFWRGAFAGVLSVVFLLIVFRILRRKEDRINWPIFLKCYASGVIYHLYGFIKWRIAYFIVLVPLGIILYQYLFDGAFLDTVLNLYSGLGPTDKLQVYMILTVAVGFYVNFIFSKSISKWRFLTEIRLKQTEMIIYYAHRMSTYFKSIENYCNAIFMFSERTASKDIGEDAFNFYLIDLKNEYFRFKQLQASAEQLRDEFYSFRKVHNMTYLSSKVLFGQLERMQEVYNEIFIQSQFIICHLNDSDSKQYLAYVYGITNNRDRLNEIVEKSSKGKLDIEIISSLIAGIMTSEFNRPSIFDVWASIKNPRCFYEIQEYVTHGKPLNLDVMVKFFKDAKK